MEEITPQETPILTSRSSFELIKGAKGYTWKIKIYNDDIEIQKREVSLMDTWANERYGFDA